MRFSFLSEKAKKSVTGSTFLLLAVTVFSGCYKEPEFAATPTIEFQDISKALDSLDHSCDIIWAVLREIRHNPMIFRTGEGFTTDAVKQMRGVRQGGSLSPIL
ncbi:MAG: hypothetical protein QMB03_06660, partial [Spirosomataceae bacterium]